MITVFIITIFEYPLNIQWHNVTPKSVVVVSMDNLPFIHPYTL